MKLISIVGARPQFIKLKPVSDELNKTTHEHIVINSGQHYDFNMSEIFFEGLNIPKPHINLGIGSGTHAKQTGSMLPAIEEQILRIKPDIVLAYGDTNTTLAAALAATKVNVPIAHIEAGLRSHNRTMPEEINRVVTDHISNLLFAPTTLAFKNLEREGLIQNSYLTGDVMADLIYYLKAKHNWSLNTGQSEYFVATIHRASNTDNQNQLLRIFNSLRKLDSKVFVIAHPRLTKELKKLRLVSNYKDNIEFKDPLGYIQMIELVQLSRGLITDSGGLQKEAFLLGVPCETIRSETEWPETLEGNMNVLNPSADNLMTLRNRQIVLSSSKPFGDGYAASKIIHLINDFGSK